MHKELNEREASLSTVKRQMEDMGYIMIGMCYIMIGVITACDMALKSLLAPVDAETVEEDIKRMERLITRTEALVVALKEITPWEERGSLNGKQG